MTEPAALPAEAGLYIHYPFCRRRCHYCDFNTYAVPDIPVRAYTDAIRAELDARAGELEGRRLVSVFLGGGTPGLWGPGPVGEVLRAVERHFGALGGAEVTIEVNPGECDEAMLRAYREESGCNRVSFGVQALSDPLLVAMDRIHSADEARAAMRAVVRAGYARWSADLIFGLPGQSLDRWEQDLRELIDHGPPHVSVYNLMVEPGTPLHRFVRDGKVRLPPDDLQLAMLERGREILEAAGLARYEISNFAVPGQHSVHNLLYWTGRPYLGLGAGAHSFVPAAADTGALGLRRGNVRKYTEYMATAGRTGRAVAFEEAISPLVHVQERLMTGLRLDAGLDTADVERYTGLDPADVFDKVAAALAADGLLATDGARWRLTAQAVPISDAVFARFF